jgi:hypothetical protein
VARSVEYVDVPFNDLGPLLVHARQIARDRDGWINLRPAPVDEHEERITEFAPTPLEAPVGLFARFRRIIAIEGTWVPGKDGRHGVEDTSVGLQHPAGRFAVRQLREAAHPVPDTWRVIIDHPKRGIVLSVPVAGGAANDLVGIFNWLAGAAVALGPEQLTHGWRGEVHHR